MKGELLSREFVRMAILQHRLHDIRSEKAEPDDTAEVGTPDTGFPGEVAQSLEPVRADEAGGDAQAINEDVAQLEPVLDLVVPARLKRSGKEAKFLIDGVDNKSRGIPDRSMLRLLAQAHRYRELLLAGQGRSMTDLAREAGVGRTYFCRVVRLGFLAPDAVQAILRDRHPPELTAKRLSLHTKLPAAWADQIAALGIA